MHFKFKHLQKIVGGFFLLTVVVIIVLLTIVARGQRWFQHYIPYQCYFARGSGLSDGDNVTINGLKAGKVKSVSLSDDNRIHVELQLFAKYADRIRQKSLVKMILPIVGSAALDINPGPQDVPIIPRGSLIPSREEGGADLDALISGAIDLIDELENPEGNLMGMLANLDNLTKSVADALKSKDGKPGMLVEAQSAVGHLDSILATLDESRPDIRDAIVEARRSLYETNKVIKALQKSVFLRGNIKQQLQEDSTLQFEGRAR
jgi:ABC-type transporter Mla subunit MlaD